MYATEYADKLLWWTLYFLEAYCDCYEYQRSLGRNHEESEKISIKYVDYYDSQPAPADFADPDTPHLNYFTLAYVEASFRFSPSELADNTQLLDQFLDLSLYYTSPNRSSTLERHDEIEAHLRKLIAGEITFADIPRDNSWESEM